jgi:hypothetical protein
MYCVIHYIISHKEIIRIFICLLETHLTFKQLNMYILFWFSAVWNLLMHGEVMARTRTVTDYIRMKNKPSSIPCCDLDLLSMEYYHTSFSTVWILVLMRCDQSSLQQYYHTNLTLHFLIKLLQHNDLFL